MKKVLILGLVLIIGSVLLFVEILAPGENGNSNKFYHVTLADPKLYVNGLFVDNFEIESGDYQFKFIPSGDSPRLLTISLTSDTFSYSEDFILKGTAHETEISVYYTWEYTGNKNVKIPIKQNLEIGIDPHDNLLGPVSVDLVQNS